MPPPNAREYLTCRWIHAIVYIINVWGYLTLFAVNGRGKDELTCWIILPSLS